MVSGFALAFLEKRVVVSFSECVIIEMNY